MLNKNLIVFKENAIQPDCLLQNTSMSSCVPQNLTAPQIAIMKSVPATAQSPVTASSIQSSALPTVEKDVNATKVLSWVVTNVSPSHNVAVSIKVSTTRQRSLSLSMGFARSSALATSVALWSATDPPVVHTRSAVWWKVSRSAIQMLPRRPGPVT